MNFNQKEVSSSFPFQLHLFLRGTRESMQDGGEREKVQWEILSASVRESG